MELRVSVGFACWIRRNRTTLSKGLSYHLITRETALLDRKVHLSLHASPPMLYMKAAAHERAPYPDLN